MIALKTVVSITVPDIILPPLTSMDGGNAKGLLGTILAM